MRRQCGSVLVIMLLLMTALMALVMVSVDAHVLNATMARHYYDRVAAFTNADREVAQAVGGKRALLAAKSQVGAACVLVLKDQVTGLWRSVSC